MPENVTPERAALLIRYYGGWFGPPALLHRGTYIDGRSRIEALKASPLIRTKLSTHTLETRTDSDAARFLMLAGHHQRALELVPEALRHGISDVATFCDLSREEVALAFPRQRPVRMKQLTTPRRRQAIERIAQLLREGEQSADGKVHVSRIREALGPWL